MTGRGEKQSRTQAGSSRPRNAALSKQQLLDAGRSLFGQRGFESTTVRDIGDSAGVDPALIARYFGSKADLYIAAVVAEAQGDRTPTEFEGLADMARTVVDRIDEHGIGPVTQALIRSETADEIREAAHNHMARRMVAPMAADLSRRGVDEPRLRAEIVVSALIGVTLGRALGWFDDLKAVPKERLVDLVIALLDGGSTA